MVEKMWGGRKLQTVLGKALPADKPIGESWELFDFPPGVVDSSKDWISSQVTNGPLAGRTLHWLVENHRQELLGPVAPSGEHGQFPILIKFLDAREDLSVQVHPDREYADCNPHAHLKSEAWYVLQADRGSRLLNGLKPGVTRDGFKAAIDRGDVDRLIEAVEPREGECFYLPSGTVHALGAGILVAEVQTPSDTTFRVFDFNRIDPSIGKPRALHVEEALVCIDFSSSGVESHAPASDSQLVTCPYFHLEKVQILAGDRHEFEHDGPMVLIVIEGRIDLAGVECRRGEVVLLPACLRKTQAEAVENCTCLAVTFPF